MASSLGRVELLIILFLRILLTCKDSTHLEPLISSGEVLPKSKGFTNLNLPLCFIFFLPEALGFVVALAPISVEYLNSFSISLTLSELT